jgi:hypothetical protein
MIGCGGMLIGTQEARLCDRYERSRQLVYESAALSGRFKYARKRVIATAPKFPRKLYFLAGNAGWKSTARKTI